MPVGPAERALIDAALEARTRSYAPYSKFHVGAALLLRDGRIVTGTNVENVSYGLTVCAERHAIAAAVGAGAKPGDVVSVAIVALAEGPTPPCGACRQVLAEFMSPDAHVLMHNLRDQQTVTQTLGELLPSAFLSFAR